MSHYFKVPQYKSSRHFDGVDDSLTWDGTPPAGLSYPFTVAAWGKCDPFNSGGDLWFIGQSDALNGYSVLYAIWSDADVGSIATVQWANRNTGGSEGSADGTNEIRAHQWFHGCGVSVSTTERYSYANGSSGKGSNTTSITLNASANRIAVGRQMRSTPRQPFRGCIAYPAIWNVALTDVEVDLLAAGASPLTIRRQNLVFYIDDMNTAVDIIGGKVMTINGATPSTDGPLRVRPDLTRHVFAGALAGDPLRDARLYRMVGGEPPSANAVTSSRRAIVQAVGGF